MDNKKDEIVASQETIEAVESEDEGSKKALEEKLPTDDELPQESSLSTDTPKSSDELIDEARAIVEASDSEVRDCMQTLDADIKAFEDRKSQLLNGSAHTIEELLDEVGFEPEDIVDIGSDGVDFAKEERVKPMRVKSLSSGRFSSFILGLIVAFASAVGWIYVATEKLGLTLDVSKLPTPEVQNQIFSWIGGGMTGGEGNPMYGMGIVALTAIISLWVVYAIRVYLRSVKNQKIAEKINEDAKFYCTEKEECKKEMESVSRHIHEVIKIMDTYDILFEEQNAKIRRIIHLEGKLPFHEYHQKSKDEMNQAGILVESLSRLISTAMADEHGSLSTEAKDSLSEAMDTQKRYIDRFYQ
ncbi:ORF 73; extensive acidic domains, potential leucine zipper; immediate early protein homolog [hydrothermal vent metagenome]|uniref:ORF 73 extensive acidic domains, potential leucine zipper immediate early protein homolog n=1 Tax=hydrothermal vent metagenome TaxID=652676 RepID=A0A1W1BIH9_9ZZZZ